MILESVVLDVKPGREFAFEAAFGEAKAIISSMPGFVSWNCNAALKPAAGTCYDPFPTVEHYEPVCSVRPGR